MNKAYKDYQLNGWDIRASEYYNDWELSPIYDTIPEWENFINNENIRYKKLVDAKKYVKSLQAEELKNKYLKVAE